MATRLKIESDNDFFGTSHCSNAESSLLIFLFRREVNYFTGYSF
jgi:hypothetical protein